MHAACLLIGPSLIGRHKIAALWESLILEHSLFPHKDLGSLKVAISIHAAERLEI